MVADGTTGRLEAAPVEDWIATGLHAGLSAFYLATWSVDRLREHAEPWESLDEPASFQVFRMPDLLAATGLDLPAWIGPSATAQEASLWNALATTATWATCSAVDAPSSQGP